LETAQSGFRAEAQQEAALARGEALSEIVERHEHKQLRGPSAIEDAERLEAFGERVRFMGRTPDRAQLLKLMSKNDPHIYLGKYVTCSDNPDRRQCRLPGGERPDVGNCKPLSCRNVALTEENIAAWTERLNQLDHQMANPDALAPLVRARLQDQHDDIHGFLSRWNPPEDNP
jgi:hypothetical protein